LALVELSIVEQRYRAVLAVLAGEAVVDVAAYHQVSRQSVHTWLRRYRADGLSGLADRSRRPVSCPHQAPPQVEAVVCELRREHPRWGPRRLVHELARAGRVHPVPSRMTVHRILVRHGLIEPGARRKKCADYVRWERPAPMALWQLDIMGSVLIADRGAVGGVREVKLISGIDGHSRFCVIATVTARTTSRAVCSAFLAALTRFGVPEQVLTDNGVQFTGKYLHPRRTEVLFDRICARNGIDHLLTKIRSPTTTGKIERWHQGIQTELLDDHDPFDDLRAAQAAVDEWVHHYNHVRPHQARDMDTPASHFTPIPRPAAHRPAALDPARAHWAARPRTRP
jgi:transposase InsO family protein